MSIIGYARVSSVGQSLDVQLQALDRAGCDKVYQEKRSGLDSARPQLSAALDFAREGDTFVVTKVDRLARSTAHLHNIVRELQAKGVAFKVLDQSIDTSTSQGQLLFGILATIAEFETSLRAERQREGIAKALDNGVRFGRDNSLNGAQKVALRQAHEAGYSVTTLMERYGVSRSTVYRVLRD